MSYRICAAEAEKVVERTIADFKSRGPSWISQEVAKEYGIKKADVNEAKTGIRGRSSVRVHGTRIDDLSIIYRGRVLTPTHFGMKPKIRPAKGPYVVTAMIKRSSGRESLGKKYSWERPTTRKQEHHNYLFSVKVMRDIR